VAAFTAVMSNFCVITGGPGTGKTRTVAAILALLLEQAGNDRLRIALAAPSGKAAARLKESVQLASNSGCPRAVWGHQTGSLRNVSGLTPRAVRSINLTTAGISSRRASLPSGIWKPPFNFFSERSTQKFRRAEPSKDQIQTPPSAFRWNSFEKCSGWSR
jgi:hypothetical protein